MHCYIEGRESQGKQPKRWTDGVKEYLTNLDKHSTSKGIHT